MRSTHLVVPQVKAAGELGVSLAAGWTCGMLALVMERPGRFGAVDVHYFGEGGCRGALVVASDLSFSAIEEQHVVELSEVLPYESGALYKRELPPVRAVLAATTRLDLLLVDGYVTLDPGGRAGLGARAHREFDVPVVGVAKNPFRSATHAQAVVRGASRRPVFVTAVGIDPSDAAELVRNMAGSSRIPDALARVDRLARGRVGPG